VFTYAATSDGVERRRSIRTGDLSGAFVELSAFSFPVTKDSRVVRLESRDLPTKSRNTNHKELKS